MAEQVALGPKVPSAKVSGVVNVRVTSAKERSGEDWGGCGLETRLFRKGQKLKPIYASRLFPPDQGRAQPGLAVPLSFRDGAEKSYFVCQTMWGCCPATLLDYSSRFNLAGANRGPAGGSRRGW